MFRLYRVNKEGKPEILEYFNNLPKLSASFKAQIRERYGSGAFYLQEYGKNTKKHTFAVEGNTLKNGDNSTNMDMQTIVSLVRTLEEINIRTKNIEKKLDDLFEDDGEEETPSKGTESPLASAFGLSGDQASHIAALAGSNPELAKALQTFQSLGFLKQ